MSEASEPAVDVISRLVPAVLKGLYALEFAGRHLAPNTLPQLVEAVGGRETAIDAALTESQALDWPERLVPARDFLHQAARATHDGLIGLLAAGEEPQPIVAAYRAVRNYARASEAIYPLAVHLRPVSQFFLEPKARGDAEFMAAIAAIDPMTADVGPMHVGGPSGTRGGFSLYVPEYYEPSRAWPLVVAMHGGSGNGGAFLWSWLREARTRGFILLSPTAKGSTWSLMNPDEDGPNIDRMVAEVGSRWNIDPAQKLMTGMSDGGTMTYVLGLRAGCQFTHLAPIAAAFHPMLLQVMADADRVRGLPIHIVHGAQDWMFPARTAQTAEQVLAQAGADVVYREVPDLSHTYPRDENGAILDWFLKP